MSPSRFAAGIKAAQHNVVARVSKPICNHGSEISGKSGALHIRKNSHRSESFADSGIGRERGSDGGESEPASPNTRPCRKKCHYDRLQDCGDDRYRDTDAHHDMLACNCRRNCNATIQMKIKAKKSFVSDSPSGQEFARK